MGHSAGQVLAPINTCPCVETCRISSRLVDSCLNKKGKSRAAHSSFSQHLQGPGCSPWTALLPRHTSVGWKASFIFSSVTFLMPCLQHRKAGLTPGARAADSGIPFTGGDTTRMAGDKQGGTGLQLTLCPQGWQWTLPWWICRLIGLQDYTSFPCVAVNPLVRCLTETFCPLSQEEISLQLGNLFPVKLSRRIRFPERACSCNKGLLPIF